ncbi:hypothetical protein PBI_LUCKY3_50 [Microbacterium phage Lucky3]|uniref:Uncharacterized protein n=2 Tax=Kojivirus golden TaxID=2560590 RepID=A0A2P1CFU1_9CAUD|nr:hypothetical protein FDJ42_gp50 [Microbacterium phage Golden]AVJ49797.1 hypothetical protein PBI_GOLDEN_50 [Microbacterium phage Golden]AVJ50107.1 hypothetical protein PBI_LUCKY3_50 [Microbacterium phage Lucky3]
MEDSELLKMLDGLVKLTPEEEAASPQPMSKTARKKLWRDQPPDPNSNTSKKKERARLAARTPEQVRRDEILEERKRLQELAKKANADRLVDRIDNSPVYNDARRHYAEHKKVQQKRKKRSRPV